MPQLFIDSGIFFVKPVEIHQPFQFAQLFQIEGAVEALYRHAQEYLACIPHVLVHALVIFAVDGRDVLAEVAEFVFGEPEEQVTEFHLIGAAPLAEGNEAVGGLFQYTVHFRWGISLKHGKDRIKAGIGQYL